MRELILNNFLKKYLAQSDALEQVSGPSYLRLQRILSEHIDEYLSLNSNRSVKVLEEQMWQLAKS